jgi:hypothetical protein
MILSRCLSEGGATEEDHQSFSQGSLYPDRYSNPAAPEPKSKASPIESVFSVSLLKAITVVRETAVVR